MSAKRTEPSGGCADCKRDYDTFEDFHVETAIWNFVFAGQAQTTYTVRAGVHDPRLVPRAEGLGGVLCLDCFARRADALGVDWGHDCVVSAAAGPKRWTGEMHDEGPTPEDLEAAEARASKAEKALSKYGDHTTRCPVLGCTCGFDEALSSLDSAHPKEPAS